MELEGDGNSFEKVKTFKVEWIEVEGEYHCEIVRSPFHDGESESEVGIGK